MTVAMLDPIIDLVTSNTPLPSPWGRVVVIVALFAIAWAISRLSASVARRVLAWHDRRHEHSDLEASGKIAELKRRETLVSVIRTGIAYAAFATAIVLSFAQLAGGIDRFAAIAGASLVLVVAGVSAQRVLVDIITGLTMFVERWYSVGDTVVLIAAGVDLQGVVEDVSLRRTRLRSLNGEVIRVPQLADHRRPRAPERSQGAGYRAVRLQAGRGRAPCRGGCALPARGPDHVRAAPLDRERRRALPRADRIRLRVTVAPGREWLAEEFFSDLLKERGGTSLIVHGPVTLAVDERATRTFARASATTRSRFRPVPQGEAAGVR